MAGLERLLCLPSLGFAWRSVTGSPLYVQPTLLHIATRLGPASATNPHPSPSSTVPSGMPCPCRLVPWQKAAIGQDNLSLVYCASWVRRPSQPPAVALTPGPASHPPPLKLTSPKPLEEPPFFSSTPLLTRSSGTAPGCPHPGLSFQTRKAASHLGQPALHVEPPPTL